jgi:hypothetical protein
MDNITLLEWDTNMCLVYRECAYLQWDKYKWFVHGDCLTFPMGHSRLSRVCGLPRFFNGTQMSASCMENITHLQWDKNNNFLVFRIPRSINGTHMSASYMENITLLQWDKNNNFLYGEFHVPSMGSRNMSHTITCVSIAHGFHQLYGFIL